MDLRLSMRHSCWSWRRQRVQHRRGQRHGPPPGSSLAVARDRARAPAASRPAIGSGQRHTRCNLHLSSRQYQPPRQNKQASRRQRCRRARQYRGGARRGGAQPLQRFDRDGRQDRPALSSRPPNLHLHCLPETSADDARAKAAAPRAWRPLRAGQVPWQGRAPTPPPPPRALAQTTSPWRPDRTFGPPPPNRLWLMTHACKIRRGPSLP